MPNSQIAPDFIYVIHIDAPVQKVWDALTKGEHTIHFWGGKDLRIDLRVGGAYEFFDEKSVGHVGVIEEIDAPRRMVLSFDTNGFAGLTEAPSRVTYLIEDRFGGSKLTVTHEGFPPNSQILPGVQAGWPEILSGMKTYLETGKPAAMNEKWVESRRA